MKYLVMEVATSYAVLLDEEGRMLYAANLHYSVGQTVENPILMQDESENDSTKQVALSQTSPKKHLKSYTFAKAFVSIAACLILFFYGAYYMNYVKPYSTITLSINPQVEMKLSRKGSVVGLKGLNADGEALLEGYVLKNKNKQEVANALVLRAAEMGYLKEGGTVSYTIDVPKPELYSQYQAELKESYDHEISAEIDFDFDLDIHEAEEDDDDDDLDDVDDDDDEDDDDRKGPKEDKNPQKKPVKDQYKDKEDFKQDEDEDEDEEDIEVDDDDDEQEDDKD